MRVKNFFIFCCLFFSGHRLIAQGGTWAWVNGDTTLNNYPTFGTQGIPALGNSPGGFYEGANWIDQQGDFWIFGGLNLNGEETSDLWKFDRLANEWTWMKGPGNPRLGGTYGSRGVAASSNNPGARAWGAVTWTDNNGDLWLFGGLGFVGTGFEGALNDLWKYNIASNNWTWMAGNTTASYGTIGVAATSNVPAGRYECNSAWVDANNNLWFFGGDGLNIGVYNDLWQYNTGTGMFTWMKGPQGTGQPGNYGTRGVESAANMPPARGSYTRWKDGFGNFYIWGGTSFYSDAFSDVWKYNPLINNWTWVAGDSLPNTSHSYPQYCANSGSTGPLPRLENRTAQSLNCVSAFLTFGGLDNNNNSFTGSLSDFWVFNSLTNQWKLISGSSTTDGPGYYGFFNVPSTLNLPPARAGHCMWIDDNGIVWLYSGKCQSGVFNDLWKFTPDSACLSIQVTGGITYNLTPNPICKGDTATLVVGNGQNFNISPANSATWLDNTHVLLYPTQSTVYTLSGFSVCGKNDTTQVSVHVSNHGQLDYTLVDTSVCAGNTTSLMLNNYSNTTITPASSATLQGPTLIYLHPDTTTTYTLTGFSNTCNELDTALITVRVLPNPPVTISPPDTAICFGSQLTCTLSQPVSQLTITSIPASNTAYILDSIHIKFFPQGYTYVYVVTGLNACGSRFIDSVTFYVENSEPGEDLDYVLSPQSICIGDTALIYLPFTDSGQITPAASVTWIDSTHALLHPDTTTYYTVKAKTICGWFSVSNFTLYVYNPNRLNYQLYHDTICAGTDFILTIGQGPYGGNYDSIQILPAYGIMGWLRPSQVSLRPDTTTTYRIIGFSTVCNSWDTTNLTIHVTPYKPVSLLNPDSVICPGDTAYVALNGAAYVFFTPAANAKFIDTALAILYPDSTTTYTFAIVTSCGSLDTLKTTVYVLSTSVSIVADKNSICPGDTEQICAPVGFTAYNWSTGDTTTCINTADAGNYYVTVSENGNCSAASNHISISVYQPSPVTVNINGDTLTGYSASRYQWLLNGAPIAGATSAVYVVQSSGSYTLQVTDTNGCLATSSPIVITSIKNELPKTGITIFPNPTSTGWQLLVGDEFIGSQTEVFDATGRLVFESAIRNPQSEITIPNAASGVYELRIISNDFSLARKLVKM